MIRSCSGAAASWRRPGRRWNIGTVQWRCVTFLPYFILYTDELVRMFRYSLKESLQTVRWRMTRDSTRGEEGEKQRHSNGYFVETDLCFVGEFINRWGRKCHWKASFDVLWKLWNNGCKDTDLCLNLATWTGSSFTGTMVAPVARGDLSRSIVWNRWSFVTRIFWVLRFLGVSRFECDNGISPSGGELTQSRLSVITPRRDGNRVIFWRQHGVLWRREVGCIIICDCCCGPLWSAPKKQNWREKKKCWCLCPVQLFV